MRERDPDKDQRVIGHLRMNKCIAAPVSRGQAVLDVTP